MNGFGMHNPYRNDLLDRRKEFCLQRLSSLRAEISKTPELRDQSNLCIYVTGSYGRLEASEHSDLDLFFIHRGASGSMSQIDQIMMKAEIIKVCRKLEFPEFSGDGAYLQVHFINDILRSLGSPEDDFENFFTARLLLLLESAPVHNQEAYEDVISRTIDSYLRDYPQHSKQFKPTFLLNDIMRFWKTLCLNYEAPRNNPIENEQERNKNHIRNLKLKFSRLLTCFSMVLALGAQRDSLTPDTIKNLVKQVPLQRVEMVVRAQDNGDVLWNAIAESYGWFLKETAKLRPELSEWIGNTATRDFAFDQAQSFGASMYEILSKTLGQETMRYLVV